MALHSLKDRNILVPHPHWKPEIRCSESDAASLIESQFPELAPVHVARVGHGMDNAAFLVNATYIFRFPQRAIAAPLLENEARVLPLIAPLLPLSVPVPTFLGKPQSGYPWPFSGYTQLAGRPVDSLRPDERRRASFAYQLGAFLKALHAIDPAAAVARGLPGDAMRRLDHSYRFPLAKSRLNDLETAGLVENARAFTDWLDAHPPQWNGNEPPSIVHGDLYARHLLAARDGELTGVIDWGDMHAGDPALDIMIAHALLPPAAHSAFLRAYGMVDEPCWNRAKYRAIYHAALVADFGHGSDDSTLLHAALGALENIRPEL